MKDSIAINGVCLTVVALRRADDDLRRRSGDHRPRGVRRRCATAIRVNVELSLRLGDRLGGHLVYGHVDATAAIAGKVAEGQGHG